MQRIGVVLEKKGGCVLPTYDGKTVLFHRNLTEKVQARKWTNTSYQCQCLQDMFASIQRSEINGTALGWKFMVLQVNQFKVRTFLSYVWYFAVFRIFFLMKLLVSEQQEHTIIRSHGKGA